MSKFTRISCASLCFALGALNASLANVEFGFLLYAYLLLIATGLIAVGLLILESREP